MKNYKSVILTALVVLVLIQVFQVHCEYHVQIVMC